MELEEFLRLVLQHGMSQIYMGTAIVVILTVFRDIFTYKLSAFLEWCLQWCLGRLHSWSDRRVEIRFAGAPEEDKYVVRDGPKNDEAYRAIQTYLSARRSAHALGLKANSVRDISTPVLWIDDGKEISDEFNGVTVSWRHGGAAKSDHVPYISFGRDRYFVLSFPQAHREMVVEEYLRRVMVEGQRMMEATTEEERENRRANRQLKLHAIITNNTYGSSADWECVMEFDHPAEFKTFAMEDEKKKDIINDLERFKDGEEYYRRIGKPWKRGYLLYGPPGTGKTTMIAAIANFLSYDVYDLELSAVQDNASLKRFVQKIPGKSIVVIEDIDCSSIIAGDREKTNPDKEMQKVKAKKENKTLSGLLNCVDGLFSADDGGRLIVFTTNHIEAIDPALLRRGRMDKHIELTSCGMEAFKILAEVYLRIDEHHLFERIEELLNQCSISPADVAEALIGSGGEATGDEVEHCLEKLIEVLKEEKEKKEKKEKKTSSEEGEGTTKGEKGGVLEEKKTSSEEGDGTGEGEKGECNVSDLGSV